VRRWSWTEQKQAIRARVMSASLVLISGVLLSVILVNGYISQNTNKVFVSNWWNVSIYNVVGLIGFHVFEVERYVSEQVLDKSGPSEQEIADVQKLFGEQQQKSTKTSDLYGIAKGKNVLVVQLESFQNYVIGKKINGQEITPNMNKLIAGDTLYFNHFHHQVGQGRTSDAEFLVNNSLYPLPSGSVYVRHADNDFDSLPEILKNINYSTSAFHPYEKSFWNRQVMYKNIGFDRFYSLEDFKEGEQVGWSLGDMSFFQQTVDVVKTKQQPFYAFAVALSSHHPYTRVPDKYKTLDFGDYEGTILADYLTAIHYVDASVGELVAQLKANNLWDKTMLLMYGDHDSGIPMDAEMAKFVGEPGDELNLQNIKNRVPLIIHLPQSGIRGTKTHTVSMIDMTPTILHALGISDSRYYHLGHNMFDWKDHLVVLRSGSATDGQLHYKASIDGVFTKGTCYRVADRKKVAIDQCRTLAGEADRQLKMSDRTLKFDMIRTFKRERDR
jgi:phosphoglycerol transferase MdoB-like AlkP superfamily enzyme